MERNKEKRMREGKKERKKDRQIDRKKGAVRIVAECHHN